MKRRVDKELENLISKRALGLDFNRELYNLATKRLATISALKDYARYLARTKKEISGTQLLIVIGLSLGENDNIEDFK